MMAQRVPKSSETLSLNFFFSSCRYYFLLESTPWRKGSKETARNWLTLSQNSCVKVENVSSAAAGKVSSSQKFRQRGGGGGGG